MRDDDKYLKLMDAYKTHRAELGPTANLYLQAAIKLREKGQVSQDAVIGAAYL